METIVTSILTPTIRHSLTALGGALVSRGLLDAAQGANFSQIGTGLIVGSIGLAWSFIKNHKRA